MTVERPADLFAFLVPMLEKSGGLHPLEASEEELSRPAEQHYSFIDQEVFRLLRRDCVALSECRCEQTCAPALAALSFWWFALNHEGVQRLVIECEPLDSWWRLDPEAYPLLIRFVRAHVTRITSRDIDPQTAPYQARLFHLAMVDVLTSMQRQAVETMQRDATIVDEKVTREEKQKLKNKKLSKSAIDAASEAHYQRYGHLPGIRRARSAKKKPIVTTAQVAAEQAGKTLERDLRQAEQAAIAKYGAPVDNTETKEERRARRMKRHRAAMTSRMARVGLVPTDDFVRLRRDVYPTAGDSGSDVDESTADASDDSQYEEFLGSRQGGPYFDYSDDSDDDDGGGDAGNGSKKAAHTSNANDDDDDSDMISMDDGTRFRAI